MNDFLAAYVFSLRELIANWFGFLFYETAYIRKEEKA